MRRFSIPLFLAMVMVALLSAPVSAGRQWCAIDPVVKIDDDVADIRLSSYTEMLDSATGPVAIVVTVPTGVTAELLAVDNGFGYGYEVSFAESSDLRNNAKGMQVQVTVYAPASNGTLPVAVEFAPRSSGPLSAASAKGYANSWVVATTR